MKKSELIEQIKDALLPEIRKIVREELSFINTQKQQSNHIVKESKASNPNIKRKLEKLIPPPNFEKLKSSPIGSIFEQTFEEMEQEDFKEQSHQMLLDEHYNETGEVHIDEVLPDDMKHVPIPDFLKQSLTKTYTADDFKKIKKATN